MILTRINLFSLQFANGSVVGIVTVVVVGVFRKPIMDCSTQRKVMHLVLVLFFGN